MAINFPDSPTPDDTFVAGNATYTWDGVVWAALGGQSSVTVAAEDITAGDLASDVIPYVTATSAASAFAVPFVNTTGFASGNFGTQIDAGAASLTYNPSTNALVAGTFNGVALSTGGAATDYLDETGNYSTPAGGSGTVTSSGSPLNNEVAVFATATDINSDSTFTWDGTTMFATNVTGTNIGGITQANLLDKTATETVSGNYTFSGEVDISTDFIRVSDNVEIFVGTGSDLSVVSTGLDVFATLGVGSDLTIRGGSAGTDSMVTAIADGATTLYHNGNAKIATSGTGVTITGSGTADGFIVGQDEEYSSTRFVIGNTNSDVYFNNLGTGAGSDTFFNMNNSSSYEGIVIRNLAAVELYYADVLQFDTQNYSATGATTGARVLARTFGGGGLYYDVGMNELFKFNDNVSDTLEGGHCGAVAFKDATTARTLTLAAVGALDFPVNGMTTVINAFTSTDYTITEGASTTLYYLNGSTRVDTAGGCTVGPGGVANIWREAAGVYYIWGTGITA